ncbi:hypothetical protein LCGC14_0833650 [marine sediment metagenome]|uniref:Uncharacterized protein n=1 Tax=marine sediment metagenome TaxID=412755 RepID=A0A0F9SMK7_9ZZZZ|nr:MAG: hypothetical protein Lokiarch_35370 [Candidatus Lokiarchaeum sp. GC14_75]HEC36951.1 hypothetical protein [bacterium]
MTIVDIENQISLVELIKGVLPSELKRFTRKYIEDHKFLTLKDISYSFIDTYYSFPILRHERLNLIHILNRKLGRLISELMKESLIERFNVKTYKRVDL